MSATEKTAKQLLHLVLSGEHKSLTDIEFMDLTKPGMIGISPRYAEAHKARKRAPQRTVDNAHMRSFIVHMHRLLDPETGKFG